MAKKPAPVPQIRSDHIDKMLAKALRKAFPGAKPDIDWRAYADAVVRAAAGDLVIFEEDSYKRQNQQFINLIQGRSTGKQP